MLVGTLKHQIMSFWAARTAGYSTPRMMVAQRSTSLLEQMVVAGIGGPRSELIITPTLHRVEQSIPIIGSGRTELLDSTHSLTTCTSGHWMATAITGDHALTTGGDTRIGAATIKDTFILIVLVLASFLQMEAGD